MVIPPVRSDRVTKFLKPYLLRMHFTNKFVNAQVVHTPTATVASAASTQERALRLSMEKAKESTRDVAASAKIGKILAERLQMQKIPVVLVFLKRDQKYHGKVKAVIDSLREAGVKLEVVFVYQHVGGLNSYDRVVLEVLNLAVASVASVGEFQE